MGKINDIMFAALELDEDQRAQFVCECCQNAPEIQREIESLLAGAAAAENLLASPAAVYFAGLLDEDESAETLTGKEIGSYRLIREIGHGGMGAVFLAERSDGEFRQEVAIKIIRQNISDSQLINRFKRERQILASLNHPYIAKMIDGGLSSEGIPFLAMEYVDGDPITEFAEKNNLGIRERLRLFLRVCRAVSFAHRNLIVHRDLKPSNIFVTADGDPKLLDFGLAKLLDENSDKTDPTLTIARALTPAYASPEQLRGDLMTTATDVYSLGVVLYELLTGERPFDFKNQTLNEVIQLICHTEPPRPSKAAAKKVSQQIGAAERDSDKKDLKTETYVRNQISPSGLKGDLDNIILTALRKEPERRYLSVEQFADDIERYLKELPVTARAHSFLYRAEKFIKRHKIAAAAAFLILLILGGGIYGIARQSQIAAAERDKAIAAQVRAEKINGFLQEMLHSAAPAEKGKDVKVMEVLKDAANRVETEFEEQPEQKVEMLHTLTETYQSLGEMEIAKEKAQRCLELSVRHFGENNKATAYCQLSLGRVEIILGNTADAEPLLTRSLETQRKISLTETKEYVQTKYALGEVLVRNNDFKAADSLLSEALADGVKVLDENSLDIKMIELSLRRTREISGNLDGAEAAYRKVTEFFRRSPRYRLQLLTSLTNLGRVLMQKGKLPEAEEIFTEAEKLSHSVLSNADYMRGMILNYSSQIQFYQNDYAKMTETSRESVRLLEPLIKKDNMDLLNVKIRYANGLTREGKAAEAEKILNDVLAISRGNSNNEAWRIPLTEFRLGQALTAQNKDSEAEPLLTTAVERFKNIFGEKHQLTQESVKETIAFYEKRHNRDAVANYRSMLASQ